MIDHDHNRAFVRPLVQAVEGNGQAFAEILARRAEHDPALADHLLTALDVLHHVFPEALDADRPRPKLPAEADASCLLIQEARTKLQELERLRAAEWVAMGGLNDALTADEIAQARGEK